MLAGMDASTDRTGARIEVLGPRDARALNRLTQRALREHPTAFTTDAAAVAHRRDEEVAVHLRELRRGRGFRLGAFDDAGHLVGTVRLMALWVREAGAATLVFGPGDVGHAHAVDEHVSLSQASDVADVLVETASLILA